MGHRINSPVTELLYVSTKTNLVITTALLKESEMKSTVPKSISSDHSHGCYGCNATKDLHSRNHTTMI